ncbi:hypothetical protein BGW80DRAFT_1442613 [Lactifluus volemus]|nr:hypothetical protein BGW80DRAFT_1442613 [Lactifluus volemus]
MVKENEWPFGHSNHPMADLLLRGFGMVEISKFFYFTCCWVTPQYDSTAFNKLSLFFAFDALDESPKSNDASKDDVRWAVKNHRYRPRATPPPRQPPPRRRNQNRPQALYLTTSARKVGSNSSTGKALRHRRHGDDNLFHQARRASAAHRKLADIPGLARALGGREALFETPFTGEHTGTGEQNTRSQRQDKHPQAELEITGQADGTDESNVKNVFMAETRSSEVDLVLPGHCYDMPQGGRRKKRHLRKVVVLLVYLPAMALKNVPQGRLCDDGTQSRRAAAIVAAGPCQLIAAEGIALILLVLANAHLPMKGTGNRRREASRVTIRVEE